MARDYEPFPSVAAATLHTLARGEFDDDVVDHVLSGLAQLPAHPAVEPAMQILDEAGIPMVRLSDGAAETATNFFERNWLTAYIDHVTSVADMHSY